MSDFLTNLVVRSFSPAASFQPMVESTSTAPYVEPQEREATELLAVVTPPVQVPDEPVIKSAVDTTTSTEHHELSPVAPIKFEPEKHEFQQQSVVPPPRETPDPPLKTETPRVIQSPVQPHQPATRQLMRKAVPATPQPMRAAPRLRTTSTRTHKSEPPIVEQVVEHVTENLTQQVIERPAMTIENHRHINKIQNRHEINKIENHQEINTQEITSSTFTTLVPKPSVQPLPSPHVRKARISPPLAQPTGDVQPSAAALPPETVVNVAIGRIEVRATPPPTPRRERQSTGPKIMTLDDYVQQRSRGAQ